MKLNNKAGFFLLSCILLLAFALRLYRINAPLADWHSWRQADTSSVGRHYQNYGIDLLHPRYDDLSSIPSGRQNPEGYRMVEFPFYGALHTLTFNLLPFSSFEAAGRMVSILFSLLAIVFLYLIIRKVSGTLIALLSAFIYAVLPYNIFYNRTILPESMMVAMSLGSVYFYMLAIVKSQSRHSKLKTVCSLAISLILFSTALLLKPFAVFLIAPPVFYFTNHPWGGDFSFTPGVKFLKNCFIVLLFYCSIGLIPLLLWRMWIRQFPEGIPAGMWLFNGDGIRFRGAWFYWLFAERISKLILGYWGVVFLTFGLLKKSKKSWFYWLWFLGALSYLAAVATGNVKHDYYQILIIPVLAALTARGIVCLIQLAGRQFDKWPTYLVIAVVFIFMEMFGWYQIRDFFNINHPEIIRAGEAIQQISKLNDKIIAPYGGDTAFLYQTGRKGWPIGGNIEDKIASGAVWYVSVKQDEETKDLSEKCQIIYQESDFTIINLRECSSEL